MKCCLCDKEIAPLIIDGKVAWDQGNNAQPVKDGRCCDECNWSLVVPQRISDAKKFASSTHRQIKIKENE